MSSGGRWAICVAALCGAGGCQVADAVTDRWDAWFGDAGSESPETETETEAETEAAPAPEPVLSAQAPAAQGLGTTVAGLVPVAAGGSKVEPGPLGADLELVKGITVTRLEAGWTNKPKSTFRYHQGAVFEVDADVTVDADVGINQARVLAKSTCLYKGERRASSADLYSNTPTKWGGFEAVSGEKGEHEAAFAHLYAAQDLVGHTPCQLEFRLVSPLSDKPMRVAGVWCVRGDGTKPEPCPELAPPAHGAFKVADLEFDRYRRTATMTVTMGERVWLDRSLLMRSSCDNGGGERLPRYAFTQLTWGLLDPGDMVRIVAERYEGWFGAELPCDLTVEWWRRNDRSRYVDPTVADTRCVRKFLPEDGPCGDPPEAPTGAHAVTVRKFDPVISKASYARHLQIVADFEVIANENIDGRYTVEVKGRCGKGRRQSDVWMSLDANASPEMLRQGEVSTGKMRSWVPRGASSCELELNLVPQGTSTPTPTSLGKYCVDRRGSKPC